MEPRVVGAPVRRKEVQGKLTGTAQYVADLVMPGMLHGATIRSTQPRARIRNITYQPGVPWDEFVVVTSADIPGTNRVAAIMDDQPSLADDHVNHLHEPILLIAHENQDLVRKARTLITIEYEPMTPVFDVDASLSAETLIWGSDNVFKRYLMNKGDVDNVWEKAAFIVDGEYSTGAQEQLYIEPNGMIAVANPSEGVTVWGSLQCPYYVHRALMHLFALPADKVRVVQQETGGAFGGKEEFPSVIAGHAALLAWKAGKPVKLIYDREEDMAATTKRHPSRTRHRTAIDADGKLLGMDIEFTIDGGAYATLSGVVLPRGTIHAPGPYLCENIRVRSIAVATNSPPHGAFRGFGAPQSIFALERHMNKVARAAGLTPEEFRRRNFLRTGDATATGQVITQPLDMAGLLERALREADYYAKIEQFRKSNATSVLRKGIGFSTFFHGAGFTGSGERYLQSVLELETTADGGVCILSSMTEMGQGTNTVLTQVAAETLGIPCDQVHILRPDTAKVPNSGPTVASRTSMIVGKLVERACIELRDRLITAGHLRTPYTPEEFATAVRLCGAFRSRVRYQEPPGIHWNDETYQGEAYGAYSWAAYVAEVTVDTLTGETQVDDFLALQEVGRVLNPVLAAGQIEGGVVQGLGFALLENVEWRDGAMANSQLTNYIIPTTMDVPPIRVLFEEVPYEHGALGAKGIGELPMDGPAPAILNAIENATGISFHHVPLTPEDILRGLEQNTKTLEILEEEMVR
ncbi:MAG TPA: xanthine dehydrogenase family protein molybdopterin-binding subunit [Bryobacteraceae bacterium]|jgi:CO/xanthine dehydrogenase Mo-binding subunit|nr:xanthine dehydrogenase family protein molybdopterin-binding subunit [Bryobacteraceae bacterium]